MTTPKRKKTDFEPLSDIMKGTLQKFLDESGSAVARIWSIWETAVGEDIAENAQPAFLKGNVLVVHVNSSAWLQQLRYLKQGMISNLNIALDQTLISDITFKIGDLSP